MIEKNHEKFKSQKFLAIAVKGNISVFIGDAFNKVSFWKPC